MAKSEKRREKKLMARRAQRKEQTRRIARVRSASPRDRMLMAAKWPVVESKFSEAGSGMRQALLARRGPGGQIAAALFLVDSYCLGVKDVMARTYSPDEWVDLLESLDEAELKFFAVTPEDVRKLVEGAVAYASSFGLEPHQDYLAASALFGNIDSSQAQEEYEYGKNGKPMYIPGPSESYQRQLEISEILDRSAGPDGAGYGLIADAEDFDDDDDDDEAVGLN